MLEELYELTLKEYNGEKVNSDRYVYLYETLVSNGIEIPFGVEI